MLVFDDVPRAVLLLVCLRAQDARHHGRHGPQDSYVEVHRCSSWTMSFTCPLVCCEWRHGPDSAENCLAIPQVLLIITVVDILFVLQRQSPRSRLFSRPQRFLRCRSFSGGRCPCCAGRAVPQVVHLCIQRTAWFDRGYHILRQFTKNFTFFYVKRWITDPEVDSRLSGVSASHLFVASPEEYMIGFSGR